MDAEYEVDAQRKAAEEEQLPVAEPQQGRYSSFTQGRS
jgi:hypothetical protein